MKTTIITNDKFLEWKLACLHRGDIITAPWYSKTVTGEIVEAKLKDDDIFVTLKSEDGNYYHEVKI